MSRSGFSSRLQVPTGITKRPSGTGTSLPQAGFQSINKSYTAQNKTKLPSPGEITDAMITIFGEYYGRGEQDVEGDPRGEEDLSNNLFNKLPEIDKVVDKETNINFNNKVHNELEIPDDFKN